MDYDNGVLLKADSIDSPQLLRGYLQKKSVVDDGSEFIQYLTANKSVGRKLA